VTSPSSKPSSDLGVKPLNSAGILRRADQAILAGLVVLGGLAAAFWWVSCGGLRGGIARWEELEPREARFLVDVNAADWPELRQLPEIGETLARRIVEHREEQGSFRRPEDLMKVHGIGPKTVDLLRPFLDPESWPADSPADAPDAPASPGVE
jgi:competence protein ComEA